MENISTNTAAPKSLKTVRFAPELGKPKVVHPALKSQNLKVVIPKNVQILLQAPKLETSESKRVRTADGPRVKRAMGIFKRGKIPNRRSLLPPRPVLRMMPPHAPHRVMQPIPLMRPALVMQPIPLMRPIFQCIPPMPVPMRCNVEFSNGSISNTGRSLKFTKTVTVTFEP